ncbi:hypothetical protein M434DRAFT_213687 [Hypoxylon sp. CO27-5]|nr:hypothetical protein M434DRAFT_213687 [Hypoxylon sp. CO27-5]
MTREIPIPSCHWFAAFKYNHVRETNSACVVQCSKRQATLFALTYPRFMANTMRTFSVGPEIAAPYGFQGLDALPEAIIAHQCRLPYLSTCIQLDFSCRRCGFILCDYERFQPLGILEPLRMSAQELEFSSVALMDMQPSWDARAAIYQHRGRGFWVKDDISYGLNMVKRERLLEAHDIGELGIGRAARALSLICGTPFKPS